MSAAPGRARRRARVIPFVLALACGAPAERPREPPSHAPAPSGLDGGFRRVEARGQGLEFYLPDADGWRHDPRDRRSWVATHAATRSRLFVRAWRADAISPVAECERQLRAGHPELPALDREERLDTRVLRLPGDYAAELWSGVTRSPGSAAWVGQAQLFGSDGRHCLCLAFTTSAEGADVERRIGERLGVMTRLVFEGVRRVEIAERVSAPER